MSRLALAAGAVAFVAAVATLAVPGLVTVPGGRVTVTAAGVVALALGARAALARRTADRETLPPPAVERPVPTSPPGDDVTDALTPFLEGRTTAMDRTRRGLRAAAVAVLVDRGVDPDAARSRVDDGRWTDDPVAAAYVGDAAAPAPAGGLLPRLLPGGRSRSERVRRTVDALLDRAELPPREGAAFAPVDPLPETAVSTAGTTVAAPEGERPAPGTVTAATDPEPTRRWRGVGAVALAGLGVGVVVGQPAAVLAGAVGLAGAAYARARPLALSAPVLTAERTVETTDPDPGDEVAVTLSLTNAGDRTLPDLRVVDGVAPALAVVDGTPRTGTALRPGETVTVEYTVAARRGEHDFGPVTVLGRDLAGATEGAWLVAPETPTTLTCRPALRPPAEPVALRRRANRAAGRLATDTAGAGLEFHATREYRPGDPLGRVDWNRRARTGELATVEFRAERAATVTVVADARSHTRASPGADDPDGYDRVATAAGRLHASPAEEGHRVALTAYPTDEWAEGGDADARERVRSLLTGPAALSPTGEDGRTPPRSRRRLRRRLAAGSQVLLVSSLADDGGTRLARLLEESGYPVTVLSPDQTADRTPGHRVARLTRRLRVRTLRRAGVPVVNWAADEPLSAALARAAAVGVTAR